MRERGLGGWGPRGGRRVRQLDYPETHPEPGELIRRPRGFLFLAREGGDGRGPRVVRSGLS
jgi:hypothetical protein